MKEKEKENPISIRLIPSASRRECEEISPGISIIQLPRVWGEGDESEGLH